MATKYNYTPRHPWGFAASEGNLTGVRAIHKFGHNTTVGTSFVPITLGGVYRTPQVSGATALRVKAGGDANDTAAGTGAREITLEGLDETGAYATEVVATAGASASSATTTTFLRLFRAYVSASGTYATATAGSHSAQIQIEDSSGTNNWAFISATDFPRSQSQIGVYTTPLGRTVYITGIIVTVETTKAADILLFQRGGVLDTAAPYEGMRILLEWTGIEDKLVEEFPTPIKLTELTDIGFMGKVGSSTADISVDFEMIEVTE